MIRRAFRSENEKSKKERFRIRLKLETTIRGNKNNNVFRHRGFRDGMASHSMASGFVAVLMNIRA